MAQKKIYSISIECFSNSQNKNGSQAQFANNVQQTDKGPATRTAVNFNDPETDVFRQLQPGKKYTVQIIEE